VDYEGYGLCDVPESEDKTNADMISEQKYLESELSRANARIETVTNLFVKIYEDNATSKISDEMFMQLSHKYEVERMELKEKNPRLPRTTCQNR
jgi:hypothetical protein